MPDWLQQARELHSNSLVLDLHADTPQRFLDEDWRFTSPSLDGGHLSRATAMQGGLSGEFFAAWVEPSEWQGKFAQRTRDLIAAVHREVKTSEGAMTFCTTADEVKAAHDDGSFATLLGIEGGHSIEARIDLLEEFYSSDVRYMTLTWSNSNEWADSSGDHEVHGGLTTFGREVVQSMNRIGMIVDVSHVSDKTFWDVLKTSTSPVIASHSSARALTAAPRNLTDEMMRAVADSGGIVGINFFPAFVDERWRAEWNAMRESRTVRQDEVAHPYREREEAVPFHISDGVDREFTALIERASFSALIDHFEHALEVIGPEHVALGTDFDGIPEAPAGIDSAADLPKVTAAILERGHSQNDLRKVLGENVLRVFRDVAR